MSPSGRQTATIIERVYVGNGDYSDGARVRSSGWSFQPMPPTEQQQLGLQVTRRWKAYGPPVTVPATYQVEVDDLLGEDGSPLRLDVHGEMDTWPGRGGRAHHVEGIVEVVEGSAR